jgi:tRNA modification GTPase
VIEVPVAVEGIPLLFIDTAGLRDAAGDSIEAMGIERTHAAMVSADIILWLGDENAGPDHPELIEVEAKADDPAHRPKGAGSIAVSAARGDGIAALLAEITKRAQTLLPPPDQFVVNERQRTLLANAVVALHDASVANDWLITAEHLRHARLALDALTGRAHTEDMLDMLFGQFCVGK